MALFGRRRPEAPERRQVEAWARAAGGFGPDTVLKVSEIVCPDPACPGTETVILVLAPGAPARAVKIARPLAEIGQGEVAAALAGAP